MVNFAPSLAVSAFALAAHSVMADVDFVLNAKTLTVSRIDPLMNPGTVSGHVHHVVGGSRFRDRLMSTEDMLKADCSTTNVQEDKSNYWIPLPYWMHANGSYSALSIETTRLYYFGQGPKVEPFPKGLRMLSGKANVRDESSIYSHGIHINTGVPNKPGFLKLHHFPNSTTKGIDTAPDVLRLNVNFPSCGWANQSLDSVDHFSHMTWPVYTTNNDTVWQLQSGKCPPSHPIMYPRIMIEVFFRVNEDQRKDWGKNGPNFILANGDVVGSTLHGDFVNGWDSDTLRKAINDPACSVSDQIEKCPHFNKNVKDPLDAFRSCRLEGQIPAEEIGYYRPIDKLPGANPRWDWNDGFYKPKAEETNKPGFVSPNFQLRGTAYNSFPFVLPGFDKDADTEAMRSSVQSDWITPWARTESISPEGRVPVDSASVGTQQDVDANVMMNDKNKHSILTHVDPQPAQFSATAPSSVVDITKAVNEGSVNKEGRSEIRQCPDAPVVPAYGCGPGTYPEDNVPPANPGIKRHIARRSIKRHIARRSIKRQLARHTHKI